MEWLLISAAVLAGISLAGVGYGVEKGFQSLDDRDLRRYENAIKDMERTVSMWRAFKELEKRAGQTQRDFW